MEVLIPALLEAFKGDTTAPPRQHHSIRLEDGAAATLLLMPARRSHDYIGVKIVNVFPGNSGKGLPSVASRYILFDGGTGAELALLDGGEVTTRRTVAVAALAASFLARPEASSLLIVGAGRVASLLAHAFAAVRPIESVAVWDRRPERAEELAGTLRQDGWSAQAVASLEAAARTADIISCATLATSPLIAGDWLQPGVHLDLIGAFTPAMRESDDACVRRARLYVDTPEALEEAGDLVQPLRAGAIDEGDIVGTLSQLCTGEVEGRRDGAEITLFKSVGTALADLAAGALAYEAWLAQGARR